MSRKAGWTQEEEFLADVVRHWRSIEEDGLCIVSGEFHITGRERVLCWHLTVQEPDLFEGGMKSVVRVVKEFPNGEHTHLAGFLFAQIVKLGSLYEDYKKTDVGMRAQD